MTKIVPTKKKSNKKLTKQKTAVWEKRQMGNVLLIIILGIRICLAELSRVKSILLEKTAICWPGWPASRRFCSGKMDLTRAQLGQTTSNAKDNDQQDVSHLAFFPNSRNLIRQLLVKCWSYFRCWSFLLFVIKN